MYSAAVGVSRIRLKIHAARLRRPSVMARNAVKAAEEYPAVIV